MKISGVSICLLKLIEIKKNWRTLVVKEVEGTKFLVRQQLQICVFSYLANQFQTGDACFVRSESYADSPE